MLGLASKRAVVTGGGSGIGLAVVRRLSEAGAAVTVFDVDEEKRSAVGPGAAFLRVDVTDEALALLKGGALDPLALATSEIPLSAIADEGFGRLSGHHDEIKVLVHPD